MAKHSVYFGKRIGSPIVDIVAERYPRNGGCIALVIRSFPHWWDAAEYFRDIPDIGIWIKDQLPYAEQIPNDLSVRYSLIRCYDMHGKIGSLERERLISEIRTVTEQINSL